MKYIGIASAVFLITALLPDTALAINVKAKAGKTNPLFPVFEYDPVTCAPINKPKYKLTQPKNGTFKVVIGTATVNKGVCKGKKFTRVQWLLYTPNRGFRGVDRGAITTESNRFVDGGFTNSRHEQVIITVE